MGVAAYRLAGWPLPSLYFCNLNRVEDLRSPREFALRLKKCASLFFRKCFACVFQAYFGCTCARRGSKGIHARSTSHHVKISCTFSFCALCVIWIRGSLPVTNFFLCTACIKGVVMLERAFYH